MNYICHSADFSMVIIITGKTLQNAKPSPRTLLGFRIFFAAQSISKLFRSPEFFRRDCKSLTKYINRVSPQSHKGTDVLEDLSSLSNSRSSSFSCSSWTSQQSQSSQLQQQSWQGSQSSHWPSLTLHAPPEAQSGLQGV